MFRIVSAIGFAGCFVAIGLHRLVCRARPVGSARVGHARPWVRTLHKVIYPVVVLCVAALTFSGFYSVLVLRVRLSGHLLMLHTTAGGAFVVCLAILAVICAEANRLNSNEGPGLGQRIAFWLILVLALPVILSIVLSMLPLFGTDGQHFLLHIHRYSALLLAMVGIVHTYLRIRSSVEK